jgi:hypothetical protein
MDYKKGLAVEYIYVFFNIVDVLVEKRHLFWTLCKEIQLIRFCIFNLKFADERNIC